MSSLYVCRNGLDGPNSLKSNTTQPVMDKAKEWQMELLMEKLRSKAGQYKTFGESAKMLRMAVLEKRYPIDGVERVQLQKCLDTLQSSIRVTTLSGMVERLESVSRQLGLKFTTSGVVGLEAFISSDMFYVEVVLEPSGGVKDVSIHHEGKDKEQSCEELVNCLRQQDFTDFATQLEGLASIYQLNAEKAVKCNALSALQSLEADLTTLSSLQSYDAQAMLCKSPVGILLKRRGGHAMRLTYWVSPYDLLDQKTMSEISMTIEQVNKRNLGYSVTVCMEASTAHKLQVAPLVTTQRGANGVNIPVYNPLQAQNSATLPACYALRLHEPLPLCVALARRIQHVTDMECGDLSTPHPLLSLITQHASRGQLDCANNNGLYVNLPDQTHCYRMTETRGLEAVMISSIPFTHPKQVPHILGLLRQQAVFNSLISSCIRNTTSSRHDYDVTLLEVTALSWQHVSVSLEHPQEESMTTVEFDLTDPSSVKCNLFGAGSSPGQTVTAEFAAKVVQRCMSIPVTMRSLMKRWQSQNSSKNGISNGNGNFNLPLGNGGGGNGGGGQHDDAGRHGMSDFSNMRDPHIKMEPHDSSSNDMGDSASGFPSFHSPLFGDLTNASPMSSFPSSSSMINQSKEPVVINLMSEAVPKKKNRKRKVMESLWRSPKHKGDECEIIVESSSNESTPHGTPTSRDAPADFRIPTPTSIDYPHLMEEGKPDLTSADKGHSELEGMSDDVMEIQEMDVEEMLKAANARKIKKPREERKSPSAIMLDIDGKSMVPPSVSITPINSSSSSLSSSLNSVLSGMGLERRPGIEIIPIGSTPPASLPSTITITPIPPSKNLNDDRSRDRKSRDKARSDEEEKRLEKKRKRKREDSPMGPPDKLPPKQDPLSKPVSVSIKPTDSPPMSMSRPSSPAGTLRKFSTSPTHTSPLVLMSKSASSPGGMSKSSKPSPQQSPKHSPAYSTSSPKHNPMPSSVSPKHHGTSSPKHTSGSSGKPSMSTLKSAASSPSSGKSSSSDPMKVKPPSSSKDSSSSRDKDRSRMSSSMSSSVSSGSSSSSSGGSGGANSSSGGGGGSGSSSSVSSSGHQSPKLKSSSIKKQPDFSIGSDTTVTPIPPPPPQAISGPSTSPSSSQDCKQSTSSALPQIRNRKNSLSAIVDKLHTSKSQHTTCDDIAVTVTSGGISNSISSGSSSGLVSCESIGGAGNGSRDRIPTPTKGTDLKSVASTGKPGDSGKNPGEYMVKPGLEGIKLTINKTRAKEPSSKSLSSSSSSSTSGMPSSSGMVKSSSQCGSGSPKLGHTGLKPGVNSGPASKKPQSSSSSSSLSPGLPKLQSSSGSSSGSSGASSSTSGNSSLNSGLKTSSTTSSKLPSSSLSSSSSSSLPKSGSSSASKSISKSSGSPKLGSSSSSSDSNRIRDSSKPRPPKSSSSSSGSGSGGGSSSSSSDKSIFSSSKESRKSSPAPPRDDDSDRTFKAITGLESFGKQLDTKFQIPKLSHRSTNPDLDQSKKTTPEKSELISVNRNVESSKALDLVKPEAKYSISSPIPSTSPSLSSSLSAGITVLPSSKTDEKPISSLTESKASKVPSSVSSSHSSSPSPRLTPSPLPKLDSKTPTDGSPIPGLTITPIGSIASIGAGGSSSNDSMDLSIDLSRTPLESKSKNDMQRSSVSIVPSSSKDDLGIRSGSPCDSLIKSDKPRDFSMVSDDAKKLVLESALARMEESRSTSSGASQDPTDVLLDFSGAKVPPPEPSVRKMTVTERVIAALPSRRNTTPPPPMFPASPSLTMHIVKSPSSLMGPSPQSGSPCITDDDLMDEALVGMGK